MMCFTFGEALAISHVLEKDILRFLHLQCLTIDLHIRVIKGRSNRTSFPRFSSFFSIKIRNMPNFTNLTEAKFL